MSTLPPLRMRSTNGILQTDRRVMEVKIRRIDQELPLPVYESRGAAGFDLISRETVSIKPGEIVLIPANIIVETPHDYMLQISSRSSSPRKKGLMMPHSIGVIDSDYCGNGDEIKVQVYNFTDNMTTVERGEKIAQGVFVHINHAEWLEVDEMESVTRGGFGSTDNK
jgi:dUTP pyrophosphatase